MMVSPKPLQYGQYYHVYNRGNNRENLFLEERNYRYFLRLYARYAEPVADTYAYCLLYNHFHLLVRVKTEEEQERGLTASGSRKASKPKRPSRQFSHLFNAYAKGFNSAYQRTGSLFEHPFGRVPVEDEAYLVHLVAYIHQNPQKHGLVKDFRDWPYSSYPAMLSEKPTRLKRDEVLAWFHGAAGFEWAHQLLVSEARVGRVVPEDPG
jgi:REP element-mobilizing transposase RayT